MCLVGYNPRHVPARALLAQYRHSQRGRNRAHLGAGGRRSGDSQVYGGGYNGYGGGFGGYGAGANGGGDGTFQQDPLAGAPQGGNNWNER